MDIENILSNMTLREKIAFCTGSDFWHTKALPAFGVPSVMMADGPHGLRCQPDSADMLDLNEAARATCFPTAVTAAATWDAALYAAEGAAIGREAAAAGVSLVLGPGCNIKRSPLGGRNFEYLSEDPFLSGRMAAAFIGGVQSTGVGACIKHFAANNQEYKRQNGDSRVDERTLREIYLAPFEIAVKQARPAAVMCAYNKINGVHCSDDRWLLTDVLRNEWGFDGTVITDWGALGDRVAAFRAGCDLNMPGGSRYMECAALQAVRDGMLSEDDIDAAVSRILRLTALQPKRFPVDVEAHHALAQRVAEQGAVLLKNENNALPLSAERMTLFGYMAQDMRYQGTGSSHINPTKLGSLADALPGVPCYACGNAQGEVSEEELLQAVQIAAGCDTAVVAVGLPPLYESEALDRTDMRLPAGHDRLVEAVAAVASHTVVVLFGGSPMELPWLDKVQAVLYMGLPGQAGGMAAARLLTGLTVPCGKLTESWPLCADDVICADTFGKKQAEYREGIYVGYRYYETADKAVRFTFGYGLSYTTFAYSHLRIDGRTVRLTVRNTGNYDAAEVVQLYVSPPADGLFRPKKELKGFSKAFLKAGESKEITFTLDERSFAVWDDGWKTPAGTYAVLVGASASDIRLYGEVQVAGEVIPARMQDSWYATLQGKPTREAWERLCGRSIPVEEEAKKGDFTLDSTCSEMRRHSLLMRLTYRIMLWVIAARYGGRKKAVLDPAYHMLRVSATDCPLRALVINSGGLFSDRLARAVLFFVNGHPAKAFGALFGKL